MNFSLARLASFAGRNWLRLILIGCALILLSQKQVNFNVRLGHPAPPSVPAAAPAPGADPVSTNPEPTFLTEERTAASVAEKDDGGFLGRFNIFGGGDDATPFDLLSKQDEATVESFITRFTAVAQTEQQKFGVPASITLAAGLLYTRGGQSAAATEQNNYFGLGCDAEWSGPTGRVGGDCLRRYENAWTSFRDFSLYITAGKYAPMTQFGPNDYRRWALGLEELGFNGTEDLAGQLQRTIDKYQLFRFD